MEEIKVGEYVRTKYGYIAKITEIDNYIWFNQKINKESGIAVYELSKVEFENLVVKHSPNIIDLIEVGDIIEWYSEIYIGYYGINEIINRFGSIGVYAEEFDALIDLKNLTIKSVVTKEQFNQEKYEV